jgi:AcrR family transcriptional regulator
MNKSTQTNRNQRLRSRSRDRREHERQELRQAILAAAGTLFLEHGYAGFSLRQVAEQIGYSPGTIYLYFADKDDLLFHVADSGFQLFNDRQRQAAASTDEPATRLRAMARAYIMFGLEHPAHYRLMFVERPDLLFSKRSDEAATWLAALEAYEQVFHAAVNAGALRRAGDVRAMSDAWWATLHGMVTLAHSMSVVFDRARIDQMCDAALMMLFEGFGA